MSHSRKEWAAHCSPVAPWQSWQEGIGAGRDRSLVKVLHQVALVRRHWHCQVEYERVQAEEGEMVGVNKDER